MVSRNCHEGRQWVLVVWKRVAGMAELSLDVRPGGSKGVDAHATLTRHQRSDCCRGGLSTLNACSSGQAARIAKISLCFPTMFITRVRL